MFFPANVSEVDLTARANRALERSRRARYGGVGGEDGGGGGRLNLGRTNLFLFKGSGYVLML